MSLRKKLLVATFMAFCGPLSALEIFLPQGAERIYDFAQSGGITLPTGRYGLVSQPQVTKLGHVQIQAWTIKGSDAAAELLAAMIAQYERQGLELVWQCETNGCGGYDFRYGITTAPPPEFIVNLQGFYYADLRSDAETVTILVSAEDNVIYLQQITIEAFTADEEAALEAVPIIQSQESKPLQLPSSDANTDAEPDAPADPPAEAVVDETDEPEENTPTTTLPATDGADGATTSSERWVLSDVRFDFGSSTPVIGDDAELKTLAQYLDDHPDVTVYIVGHSDQVGSLSGNLSITRARAAALRQILINDYGVDPSRILAEGVGFLAPIADNATEEGRAQNRRVEAVFLVNR